MAKVAQQRAGQVRTIKPKQADTSLTSTEYPTRRPLVIAGTSEGLWFLGSEQRIELKGHRVTALAPSPNGLWGIVDRNSVWHRNPDGEWQVAASVDDLQLNCILPLNGTVLAGTSEAHLMQVGGGGIERINSFDSAEGRDEWYTPWGDPPDVRSMAVGQSGELYANVHVGGILRSDEQGQSWRPTIDLHVDVHEVLTVPNRPGLVLAATAEGLATSLDGGNSWHFDQTNLHAIYARAVTVCQETVLLTASLGPHGGRAAIYRRPLDQPGLFEKCEQGLPDWFSDNINTGCLAALGDKVAFGTSDGQIFISNDAGRTWEQIASSLAPVRCLSLI